MRGPASVPPSFVEQNGFVTDRPLAEHAGARTQHDAGERKKERCDSIFHKDLVAQLRIRVDTYSWVEDHGDDGNTDPADPSIEWIGLVRFIESARNSHKG